MRLGCFVSSDWRWLIISPPLTWQAKISPLLSGIHNQPTIKNKKIKFRKTGIDNNTQQFKKYNLFPRSVIGSCGDDAAGGLE